MDIQFTTETPRHGALIIPVAKDDLSNGTISAIDGASSGAVMRAARAMEFTGKAGETVVVAGPAGMDDAVVVLMGIGPVKDIKGPAVMDIGGKAVAWANGKIAKAAILLDGLSIDGLSPTELADAVAMGARLRNYDFKIYRKKTAKKDQKSLSVMAIVGEGADDAAKTADAQAAVAAGVTLARDLVSEPPNVLHPESYADRCRELTKLGLEVEVLDEDRMRELGMHSLLGVGQGSAKGSRLVTMSWNGGKDGDAPVAFLGKGVTFDTGGISLKPGKGMEDMKFDMGGSAAVVGAMAALAGRKAKVNAVGLVGLVENMPDGNAQRPADVVTSMSGQTIEILNTDAEGRLVLADVLTYAQRNFSPKVMIDLATLTGAIIISLAHEFGGMFTKDDDLAKQLHAAGEASGEALWRMPLNKAHDEMIKSDIADMKNIGGGPAGGSSTAAAFLARFVEDGMSWAHLDIAGMAWADKDKDICPKGATGYGVRLLDAYVRQVHEG